MLTSPIEYLCIFRFANSFLIGRYFLSSLVSNFSLMKAGYLMLAVFVLGISFTLQGQNWDLINKNNVYNYSLTRGSTANADATIWTDSTGLEEGDSVFFLNRVMLEDPGGFYYFLNQSQFLQGKVRMKNPESWVFSGPETFEINPMAQENESWLFDTTILLMR